MKKLVIILTLLTSLMAQASIDEATMKSTEATSGEIKTSRSCFKELEILGCRHPREDLDQFRSCMRNVYSSLSPSCQKMVTQLYGRRNQFFEWRIPSDSNQESLIIKFMYRNLRNQTKKSPNQTLGAFLNGALDRNRTYDLPIRNRLLYPAELPVRIVPRKR